MAQTQTKAALYYKKSELERLLGQTLTADAIRAGWLKPIVKRGLRRPSAMILYSAADLAALQMRLAEGQYPGNERVNL